MNVDISLGDHEFVDSAVKSGQFHSAADVVHEALALLRRREAIRRDVQLGLDQLARGEGIHVEREGLRNFFEELTVEADRDLHSR